MPEQLIAKFRSGDRSDACVLRDVDSGPRLVVATSRGWTKHMANVAKAEACSGRTQTLGTWAAPR